MNKHLPPSNIREITVVAPAQPVEQFIVIRRTRRGNVSYVEEIGRAHV